MVLQHLVEMLGRNSVGSSQRLEPDIRGGPGKGSPTLIVFGIAHWVSGPRACRRCYEYRDVERLASPNQFRTNFVPASEKFDSSRSPLGALRQALPALLRLAR